MVQHQGTPRTRSGPVRTCVGCRARTLASELLRVVVVDGAVVPDTRRRLPGRGAWLHLDPECLRLAERRRAFSRALRVGGAPDVAGVRAHLTRLGSAPAAGEARERQRRKQVDPS
ncbi:YlxR family protein [Gandjariella thermophila]|uniref:YlxR family protein n=1 Tax=Gandjariella thermophila TaxID=1931992 RepID=UPI0010F64625|nr:YlxR family protein [Gandjariella thermophila]